MHLIDIITQDRRAAWREEVFVPAIIPLIIIALIVIAILVTIIRILVAPKRTDYILRLVNDGKYAAAIKLARSMLENDKNNIMARYYLGKAYLESKQYDDALTEFTTINETAMFGDKLKETEFRPTMAKLYEQFDQPEEALKEYILLTKADPQNDVNYYECGRLFEKREKPDQAIKYYTMATQHNIKNQKAHMALSLMYLKNKQMTDARREVDLVIKSNSNNFAAYYYLGKILKETKDYAGAVNAFEKAIRDNEYKQRALLERGACFLAVKSYDKAISELERAISCSKNNSSNETIYARYFLATCYEQRRDIDNAIKQWEAIRLVKRNFRDVNAKLSEYSDLSANDRMKDYLTSSSNEFVEICKKLALKALSFKTNEANPQRYGCSLVCEQVTDNWMSGRAQKAMMYCFRDNTPVEETFLRMILDDMKKRGANKCIVCTTGTFTSPALQFAENRPFELIGKDQLTALLTKAD